MKMKNFAPLVCRGIAELKSVRSHSLDHDSYIELMLPKAILFPAQKP
jgi:hypothetical protein